MQKITPFLWFESQAEAAIAQYIGLFPDSRLVSLRRYPEESEHPELRNKAGKVLTAEFELAGQQFMALDGGDYFLHTPAISLFVASDSVEESQRLWDNLSEGGKVLMPFAAYPFSPGYGWCNDRYGVSWQVYTGSGRQRITPMLMFVGTEYGRAEEAMRQYVDILGGSIGELSRYPAGDPQAGAIVHGRFELAGEPFLATESNLKHDFTFSGALSFFVNCPEQSEVDRLWEQFGAGGQFMSCGWVKDRYGVYWQIVPEVLLHTVMGADPEGARRAMSAMLRMEKLDGPALEAAYRGAETPS